MANTTNTVDTTATTVEATTVEATTVQPTVDTKEVASNLNEAADVLKWARERMALDQHRQALGQSLEDSDHYTDLGPVYASATPVANAFGAEVGVVTRDDKAGTVQRTGIGLYIRSDHAANFTYAAKAK